MRDATNNQQLVDNNRLSHWLILYMIILMNVCSNNVKKNLKKTQNTWTLLEFTDELRTTAQSNTFPSPSPPKNK